MSTHTSIRINGRDVSTLRWYHRLVLMLLVPLIIILGIALTILVGSILLISVAIIVPILIIIVAFSSGRKR